ncbi:hypothetical protein KIN20_017345 [Parelaphostrongylus tenuis]|uniref:Uncharacterized protein n=1 Tax=Parelaphostrongylus tenuis TaxID=148309 RepID=A0AAD5N2Z7_PARTN|nr:hypothetical protein KIN20_017345 [Parelaphostrongylus tenuis]
MTSKQFIFQEQEKRHTHPTNENEGGVQSPDDQKDSLMHKLFSGLYAVLQFLFVSSSNRLIWNSLPPSSLMYKKNLKICRKQPHCGHYE